MATIQEVIQEKIEAAKAACDAEVAALTKEMETVAQSPVVQQDISLIEGWIKVIAKHLGIGG